MSLTTAFVHTETELIANRFVLGIAEGGVLTCTIVLIRSWFTRAERARANTMFLLSLAVAPVIASPVSGLILSISSIWRTMFIIEAVPALVWAAWSGCGRSPIARARRVGCRQTERRELLAALDAESRTRRRRCTATGSRRCGIPTVLLLALYNFLALMAEWGVNFWLPTVLKETGLSIGAVGLFAALPYVLGASR